MISAAATTHRHHHFRRRRRRRRHFSLATVDGKLQAIENLLSNDV